MPNYFKQVDSLISSKTEAPSTMSLSNTQVAYILANRNNTSDKHANYFSSFNLPANSSYLLTGGTTSLQNPELYQLNVDNIVVIPIERTNYQDYIDGRTITLSIPQTAGVKTIVSSTYNELQDRPSNIILGSNIAFLFCDSINKPYSGTTGGNVVNHSNVNSWNPTPTNFLNRPYAVAYSDLKPSDIDSDSRPWSSVNCAVSINEGYPSTLNKGYNYDIPVGFAVLDKGYLVITHPSIVNNMPTGNTAWVSSHFDGGGNLIPTGYASDDGCYTWTGATSAVLTYNSISIGYDTSIVCLAMPGEFFISTNPTWDLPLNLQEQAAGSNNFSPIYVTQLGLYNANQELIAVAKFDRPIQKTYTSIITFNLDIDV